MNVIKVTSIAGRYFNSALMSAGICNAFVRDSGRDRSLTATTMLQEIYLLRLAKRTTILLN
jgi:hypothetical protein